MRTPWPPLIGTLVGGVIGPGVIMHWLDGEPDAQKVTWIFAPVILGFLVGFWIDVELDKPPSRRLFRFSLRTMFVVVTVVAVWLGWELKFVRERQAWVQANKALIRPGEPVPVGSVVGMYIDSGATQSYFPIWRRWLGDAPVPTIVFPEPWTNHDSVKRLFPEAELFQVCAMQP
jgi:hypothetical protein